jgi:bacteriorhodopsin
MSSLLTLGVIIFSLSSLYFLFRPKAGLNSPFLVSITTLISYIVMLEGSFLVGTSDTGLYWTRWVFYGISCPLLIYEISDQLGLTIKQNITNMFLTGLVMITGVLSSISSGGFKLAFFAISCVAFCKIMQSIFTASSSELKRIAPYMILGWSMFPLVFIISFEGYGLIQNSLAAIIYLALDLLTKIIFYIHYSISIKKGT